MRSSVLSNEPNEEQTPEARERLRQAVHHQRVDPALRVKVRHTVAALRRPSALRWNAAAALTLVLVAGVWTFEQRSSERLDDLTRLLAEADPLLRDALGYHLACVLKLHAPSLGLARQTPVRDSALAHDVEAALPPGYRPLDVHQCRYEQRESLHFVLEHGRQPVSLLIASHISSHGLERHGQAGRFHLTSRSLPFHAIYLVSESARVNQELLHRVTVRLTTR